MQRVHEIARVDGAHGGDQRLPRDMTAERALPVVRFGTEHAAAVDVDLELFEIKDLLDRHA